MNRRGVSLLELVITLATLSIALSLVVGLVSQYRRLLLRDSSQSQVSSQFQQVNLLRSELSQALNITVPALMATTDHIEFTRVDPLAPRLDGPAPPNPYAPSGPGNTLGVSYYLDASNLHRQTVRSNDILLSAVVGLSATRAADGRLLLKFTFRDRNVLRVLPCEVLPCVR